MGESRPQVLRIELCRVGIDPPERLRLTLPAGSTVRQALQASGLVQAMGVDEASLAADSAARLATQPWSLAIYGRRVGLDEPLHDHDRIELLPPVVVDPKVARQRRAEHRRLTSGERRWAPHRARPMADDAADLKGKGGQ